MIAPRHELVPKARGTKRAQAVIEIAAATGHPLDDWQAHVVKGACLTTGKPLRWAAFEVGVNVSRQNGKGDILQARELAGIVDFGERLVTHSSHMFDTSLEAFLRMEEAIEEASLQGLLRPRGGISRSHGDEGFKFRTGQRIRYRTRTKGGGRGFSGDLMVLDEAMILPESALGALLPTLSAKSITGDPQLWYAGSAVDQIIMEHGIAFARVRKRALEGARSLAYFEWSADAEIDELDRVIDDREQWRKANPSLGIRISEAHVEKERSALDPRTFGTERLGVGDWPPVDVEDKAAFDFSRWLALVDEASVMVDPICIAFDVTPDRRRATISAAGRRPDGLFHVETVEARRGTGWIPAYLAERVSRHAVTRIVYDPASPAAGLVLPLEKAGLELEAVTAREYAGACGLLFDLVQQGGLRHLGTYELNVAVRNASTRPLGEAWAWSRRLSSADISPLVAATLALWAAAGEQESVYESRGLLAV